MNSFSAFITAFLLVLFFFAGCNPGNTPSSDKAIQVPAHIDSLEDLTVYSFEEQLATADTVELIRETVFESNEEVFMEGYTGEIAIDEEGRVFIVSSVPGTVHIYVFNPDGGFVTKFFREGRGRGESEAISSIQIKDDKVYLLGPRLQKILVYSAIDYSFISDAVLKRDSVTSDKFSRMRATDLYVDAGGRVILKFKDFTQSDTLDQIYYYSISKTGQILPNEVFTQRKYDVYPYEMKLQNGGSISMAGSLPFSRSSLFSTSQKGLTYEAWTEDFLIKVNDINGNYKRAFFYPYENAVLNVENLQMAEGKMEALEKIELPQTWPAIQHMIVDEDQIWVASVTDSDSTYQWFVLESTGELKAEFTFSGRRSESNPMFQRQLPIIKNGYFYTRERNISEAIDRIVKYRIDFKPKEAQ